MFCIQNVYITLNPKELRCKKHILRLAYFLYATLVLYKKYTNVYKMYRSQSTLRQHIYYTKSVQKCVLFVYTLVPNV